VALDDLGSNPSKSEKVRSCLYVNGKNRWFDQSFTIIVDSTGSYGSNFEHSWGDGLSLVRWCEFISNRIEKWRTEDFGELIKGVDVEKIDFGAVSTNVLKVRDEALSELIGLGNKLGLETRVFSAFGVEKLKKCKVSPDGTFQQAIQLAYRRLTGKTVATYESCSTQTFLGGRTETIRSASPESQAFVLEMVDCLSEGDVLRAKLLRTAISRHSEIANEAASGKGFDRHIFALKKLAESKNLPLPDMLKGKGSSLLEKNIISTSSLSHDHVDQAAFGPVVSNGLGICYHFFLDRIHFCVTSYEGNAFEFSNKLEESLRQIESLLESSS